MKLLRTIQLDPSDTLVFDRAAEPGEWAVPGGFMFAGVDPATLTGKVATAFRNGFLGVQSFGWSTLAQVVEVTDAQYKVALESLTYQFREQLGAPDLAAASAAAEEELAFAASLCDRPKDTLIAVNRTFEDGSIRESFRSLHPPGEALPMRAFSFVEVEGDDEPVEQVSLVDLAKGKQP
jgi:Family of unknown function (DUF6505)